MEIKLFRTYASLGTNGEIWVDGSFLCYSIELPWRDNQPRISCIQEGFYNLVKRYSVRFGWHVWLKDVPGRSLILFHPANAVLEDLEGCIAPVNKLQGPGKGSESKRAFIKFRELVYRAIAAGDVVELKILEKEET